MKIQENRKINKIECNEKVRWRYKKIYKFKGERHCETEEWK